MDVYWLEQAEADIPQENDWLSQSESIRLGSLRFAKRRADWRLGRWTAKCAVAAYLNLPAHPRVLAQIEIRPAPSGVPEVFFASKPAPATISLSHRAGTAICAVAAPGVVLGCDLEMIEPRSDAFVSDYFTADEQALVARTPAANQPGLLALLWSGKESALKALRVGLRLDTRCVIVSPGDDAVPQGDDQGECVGVSALPFALSCGRDDWRPLRVRYAGGCVFHGWWMSASKLVCTVVADPPPIPPILLNDPVSDGSRLPPGIRTPIC
jgi:4'-phosphopantetheinyl transferase